MAYLIDTNIWIAIERFDLSLADIESITRQEIIFISPINIAELCFGAFLTEIESKRRASLSFLKKVRRRPLLRITGDTAEIMDRLSADLRQSGRDVNFRINDMWLAAQALQRDLDFITGNGKHFRDIPRLKILEL